MYGEGIPLCRVDFTQYQFYTGTNYVYLVFIFNQKHWDHVWAFLEQARDTQRFTIYTCTSVPSGPIQIIASLYVHVDFHGNIVPQADGHTDPNIAHENFKPDCYYFELHGVTYEQYMVSIIEKSSINWTVLFLANVHESGDLKVLEESDNFQFIGPDRETIDIETVEQCINIADIVRDINKPNYQQARSFSLKSVLNLQAWVN